MWEGYHALTGRSVTDFTLFRRHKGSPLLLRVGAAEVGTLLHLVRRSDPVVNEQRFDTFD